MNIYEYLELISNIEINNSFIKAIEKEYKCDLPIIIKQILSSAEEPIFIEFEMRIMSQYEIMYASKLMDYDFISNKLIPIIDCYDNDYVVFDYGKNEWVMFNNTDECIFKRGKKIVDVIY